MKWARKTSTSLISWFSKTKQKRRNHEPNSAKNSKQSVLDLPSPMASVCKGGRYYGMDEDDAFWRISFGDDRIPPRRCTGEISASDHDLQNHIFSDFKSLRLAEADVSDKGECMNFSEMVSDIQKMRERRGKERVKDVRETRANTVRSGNMVSNSRKLTRAPKSDHDYDVGAPTRKLKEIKMKPEPHVKKSKENCRVAKACSPRTECKIRALEELKKARAKEKAREERVVEMNTVFDSRAVIKRSVDPQRDFKDSMVEMIREKGIGHPNDLQQLLACYLTLNCEEYHDLIISIFRQVCVEMKGACNDRLMKNVPYFD